MCWTFGSWSEEISYPAHPRSLAVMAPDERHPIRSMSFKNAMRETSSVNRRFITWDAVISLPIHFIEYKACSFGVAAIPLMTSSIRRDDGHDSPVRQCSHSTPCRPLGGRCLLDGWMLRRFYRRARITAIFRSGKCPCAQPRRRRLGRLTS